MSDGIFDIGGGEDVPGVGPVPQDAMDEAQSDWDGYSRGNPDYQDQLNTIADGSEDLDSARWAAELQMADAFSADSGGE